MSYKFDLSKPFEVLLEEVLRLPYGKILQRCGEIASQASNEEIEKQLKSLLKQMGKSDELEMLPEALDLGQPSLEIIAEAIRHLKDEFPNYVNSQEVGFQSKYGDWFCINCQADLLPIAQSRTLFYRDEPTFCFCQSREFTEPDEILPVLSDEEFVSFMNSIMN